MIRNLENKYIDYIATRYNNLSLAVYKENKKAIDFYINRGFKIIQEQLYMRLGMCFGVLGGLVK